MTTKIDHDEMTADQFKRAVKRLGLTVYNCWEHLGITRSTANRYAIGEQPVPPTLARLVRCYVKFGLPGEWK